MSDRPQLLWFKARVPTAVRDGSSMVSLNLADCLAERFDIDLVCLRRTGREDELSGSLCPPFRSVHVIQPSNSGGLLRRFAYRAGYELRSRLSGVPRGAMYESCGNVRTALMRMAEQHQYDLAHFEYWTSAPLLELPLSMPRVLLLHDATFKAVEQQAMLERSPRRAASLRRYAAQLKRFESLAIGAADRTHFLSDWDMELFGPTAARRGRHIPVIMPPPQRDDAPTLEGQTILFVGRFEHFPNIDAARWLADAIAPHVARHVPGARFRIAGPGMSPSQRRELSGKGVELLGWVDNLEAEYRAASVVVAPIRVGTGVNTKVLEAIWRGVPVVSTTLGARATPARHGGAAIADSAEDFAMAVVALLRDRSARLRQRERAWDLLVQQHCSDHVRTAVRDRYLELTQAADPLQLASLPHAIGLHSGISPVHAKP